MQFISTEADLSHMHLKEKDDNGIDELKALVIYKEFRGGRHNFVELKCLHEAEPGHGYELHLMRLFKTHLGRVRFGYILFQALEEEVHTYNAHNFFEIDHSLLPDDVKQCMPLLPGRVCLKFLLLNWRMNRFDLVKKPEGYPDTTEGKMVRDAISHAQGSDAIKVIRKKVKDAEE